jgi:hypothetical protein
MTTPPQEPAVHYPDLAEPTHSDIDITIGRHPRYGIVAVTSHRLAAAGLDARRLGLPPTARP